MSTTRVSPIKRRGLAVAALLGLLVMFAPAQAQAWSGPDPAAGGSGGYAIATEGQTGIIDNSLPDPGEDQIPPGGGGGGPCTGQVAGHVVKNYSARNYAGMAVLRCGRWFANTRSGWGFRKLVALGRWNTWFDGMIGATLENPDHTVMQGNTEVFFTQWFTQCTPEYRFKVVVSYNGFNGSPNMQGIITAYKEFR